MSVSQDPRGDAEAEEDEDGDRNMNDVCSALSKTDEEIEVLGEK